MKKLVKGLAALVFLFTLAFVFIASVKAAPVVTLQDGASLRTTGERQGIRFTANVDTLEGATEHGFLVKKGAADLEALKAGKEVEVTGSATQFNLVIYGMDSVEDYFAELSVVAYVTTAEGTVYSNVVGRNIAEVAMKAKNAGDASELVGEVVAAAEASTYKKVWVDAFGNVNIDDAAYETNPAQLGELFVADLNEFHSSDPDYKAVTLLDMAKNLYNGYTNCTEEIVKANRLYQFYQDADMMAKWGWVLDYIQPIVNNDFLTKQVAMIKGTGTAWADWYGARHLLGRMEGFFRSAKITNVGFTASEFTKEANYAGLPTALEGLTTKFNANGNYEYVNIDGTINLPNIAAKAGYTHKYNDGTADYAEGSSYTITTDAKFAPVYTPIVYTIKFFDGDKELTDLEDTYTVENEVELPNYDKTGYKFEGWFADDLLTEAVTKIEVGNTGEKVFFAKTSELTGYTINYDLNGGYWTNTTRAGLSEELVADYNSLMSTDYTVDTFSARGSWNTISADTNFLYKDEAKAKWRWLVEFIGVNGGANNKGAFAVFYNYTSQSGLNAANGNHIYSVAYELRGFVGQIYYTKNNSFPSADYSANAEAIMAAYSATQQTEFLNNSGVVTLATAYREGYTFGGWYTTADFQAGTEVTSVSGATTVYAKWIAA